MNDLLAHLPIRLCCLFLAINFAGLSLAQSDGRYPRPEESPAFKAPTFISHPLTTAYPGAEFNMRPAVTGGTWPYHFALRGAPVGMAIDSRKGTVTWQAPLTEQTVPVTITVADLAGKKAEQSFLISVTKTGFYFVSPTGDDANPGSFEKPWKTVMRAAEPVADAANSTLYLRGGTYAVDIPAGEGKKNANVLKIMKTSPRRWVAWPGEQPVIDLGWSAEQWQAALVAEREVKQAQGSTQGYGHRILIDHGIDDLLFDGLEVKNAAYYMFVMWDGNRSRLTWRRCKLHHLYGDYAENPAFIFTFAPDRKWEPAAPGESFPFGKRPQAKPYRNLIVQDCSFSDRPYDSPRGEHGGGIVWYVTEGCLVEDSRFERIERGQCIIDKDNGWDNTYRNNVFLGDFMLAAQGCNDGINFHHNFVGGTLQIGTQPGWLRNVWIHHNSLRGAVNLMGGATTGPGKLDPGDKKLAGPADPDSQALIRDFPLDERLIFAWANAVDVPVREEGKDKFNLSRVSADAGFANAFRFVSWNGNLVDEEAEIAIGWSGKRMKWRELTTCGFDTEGAHGKVSFDSEGHLPIDSPWRKRYGRDAGLSAAKLELK